jgi:PAS domain-containing protein
MLFLYIVAFLSGYLSNRLLYQYERIENLGKEITVLRTSIDEIIENLSDGVIQLDPSMNITYANPAVFSLLPVRESIVGKNINAVFTDDLLPLATALSEIKDGERAKKEIGIKLSASQQIMIRLSINR